MSQLKYAENPFSFSLLPSPAKQVDKRANVINKSKLPGVLWNKQISVNFTKPSQKYGN